MGHNNYQILCVIGFYKTYSKAHNSMWSAKIFCVVGAAFFFFFYNFSKHVTSRKLKAYTSWILIQYLENFRIYVAGNDRRTRRNYKSFYLLRTLKIKKRKSYKINLFFYLFYNYFVLFLSKILFPNDFRFHVSKSWQNKSTLLVGIDR